MLKAGGAPKYIYNVDISKGVVERLDLRTDLNYTLYPIQIHTTAFIFLRGIEFRIFSHMCIGKRVFYKVTKKERKYMEALNLVFNFYDYEMIPLKRLFTKRSIESWIMRWRELLLYAMFSRDLVIYRKIDLENYLKPVETKAVERGVLYQNIGVEAATDML